MKYMVSIDVPSLADGLRFYRDALGFPEIARPIDTYVILQCGEARIGLMEKAAGTKPAKGSDDLRGTSVIGRRCISIFMWRISMASWQRRSPRARSARRSMPSPAARP